MCSIAILPSGNRSGARDVDDTKEIDLHLPSQLLLGAFLDCADMAITCVVHDDVNPTEPCDRLIDGSLCSRRVGDIQLQRQRLIAPLRNERTDESRAAATSRPPFWRTALLIARPKPLEAPVTNQTRGSNPGSCSIIVHLLPKNTSASPPLGRSFIKNGMLAIRFRN
jgi:hypothetical protein